MKQVALYYPWIYQRGGAERVILELVRRSRHRYTVFASRVDLAQTFPEFATLESSRLVVLNSVPLERSFAQVLRAAVTIARQPLALEPFDALVVASEGLGDFISFKNHSKPIFCVCFTPARAVFDPVYRREWLRRHPGGRIPLALFSVAYAWLTRRAWRHYRRVFADSGEVRARIIQGRVCLPEKVEVLYPGVDVAGITPTFEHDRYFLYAGRIKWTKNVELAIDAFRVFRDAHRDDAWRLVIGGGVDAASVDYVAALKERAGPDGSVHFVPNPSDAELHALYARCTALVFPSLNEDWGIVPLEVMARGKPVVAVNRGGPTESIVNNETGYLVEPTAHAFAEKMVWLASHPDELARLGQAAVRRAAEFSWDRFVHRLDDSIDHAAEGGS